jgi:hypothetical protein
MHVFIIRFWIFGMPEGRVGLEKADLAAAGWAATAERMRI